MSTAFGSLFGSRTAFTITLDSLANVTYVAATTVDLSALVGSATAPLDIIIELELTPGTVSGNKQGLLFCQVSMDGTNFSTGPSSGTTVTDQPVLEFLGVLPLLTNSTLQRKAFSVKSKLGYIPKHIKPIVFNDSGAAIAGSGNGLNYTIIYGDAR